LADATAAVPVDFRSVVLFMAFIEVVTAVPSLTLDVVSGLVVMVDVRGLVVVMRIAGVVSVGLTVVLLTFRVVTEEVLTKVCVRTWVMGLVVIVATVVTVDSLLDVFVGVVVVNFLVVVVSTMTIMNTSDITMICLASTMMTSTSATVIVFGGAHWKEPVLATFTAISAMMIVASTAPDGTRWMLRGASNPVVSHLIV